jgi:beta-lactamase regulating signal transducer with metallopeptidase domain
MMEAVLDHLWQSTLFTALAGLFVLTLRPNSARIRFWLWFATSMKFLFPFALLTALGSYLLAPFAPPVSAPAFVMMHPMAQPFAAGAGPAPVLAAAGPAWLNPASVLLMLWMAGFAVVATRWLVRWSRLRRILRGAADFPLAVPVAVKTAPSSLEPGLIGIWRPVILLPQGIAERLSVAELDAIIAHDLCHLRRRDNLLAALHMLVAALFWFHPLVWWIGARLNAEREAACDESVLASGTPPQVYVDSILKVCQFYLASPLACAAGVSGADLKNRMGKIMENRKALALGRLKKSLLAAAAAAAFAVPLGLGVLQTPQAIAQAANAPSPGTEAALRRQIAGWQKRQPVFAELTPDLAARTRQTQAATQKQFDGWGPLKSLSFKGIEYGYDFYLAEFQHGSTLLMVSPLLHGKIGWLEFEKPSARTDNRPSPGVEAALRQNYAAILKGAPDQSLFSPAIARQRLAFWEQDARNLGALKSISFAGITPQGRDLYKAVFANGTAEWRAEPLTEGKVTGLNWDHVFLPRAPRHPGTEIALRHHIESLQRGRPNYEELTPEFAAVQRDHHKVFEDEIRPWGTLRTITYKGGGTRGMDLYDVTFDHARVVWIVAPLTADGKTVHVACGEVTPLAPQSREQ